MSQQYEEVNVKNLFNSKTLKTFNSRYGAACNVEMLQQMLVPYLIMLTTCISSGELTSQSAIFATAAIRVCILLYSTLKQHMWLRNSFVKCVVTHVTMRFQLRSILCVMNNLQSQK